MAKSINSKQKRKMRAVKREKNSKREMKKLQGILGLDNPQDSEMKDLVTVKDAKQVVEEKKARDEAMDVDNRYDKKTLTDDNGQYPEWVNQRRIKKERANRQSVKKLKASKKSKKGQKLKW